MGKYQTAGGAIFQQNTMCTIATYEPHSENGEGDIGEVTTNKSKTSDVTVRDINLQLQSHKQKVVSIKVKNHEAKIFCTPLDMNYKNTRENLTRTFLLGYSSRKHTPTGSWVNATGTLTPLETPGHFSQRLEYLGIQVITTGNPGNGVHNGECGDF